MMDTTALVSSGRFSRGVVTEVMTIQGGRQLNFVHLARVRGRGL